MYEQIVNQNLNYEYPQAQSPTTDQLLTLGLWYVIVTCLTHGDKVGGRGGLDIWCRGWGGGTWKGEGLIISYFQVGW